MAQLIKLNVVATKHSKLNNKIEITFDELIQGFEMEKKVKTAKKVDHVLLEAKYIKSILYKVTPKFKDVEDMVSNEDLANIVLGSEMTLKRQFLNAGDIHPRLGHVVATDQYATSVVDLHLGAAGHTWLKYLKYCKVAKKLGSTDVEAAFKYTEAFDSEEERLFFRNIKLSGKPDASVEIVDDDVYNPTNSEDSSTEDSPATDTPNESNNTRSRRAAR